MKTRILILTCSALLLSGCGGGDGDNSYEEQPAPAPTSAPADSSSGMSPGGGAIEMVALESEAVEVGCGKCIYHMDGVETCKVAVVLEGKPVLIRGEGEGKHVCGAATPAIVSGKVEGDHFLATKFEMN